MLIDKIIQHYSAEEKDREWSSGLRGSSAGKCQRAIAYQYHGFPAEPLSARARLTFRLGDLIEKDLVEVAVKYGLTDMQKECSVEINGVKIVGHIDGILNGDTVVDFKSINTLGFSRVKKTGDVESNLPQQTFYMHALGVKKGLLVYYDKNVSQLHEVPLEYDEKVWEQIEARFKRVIASTKDALPDRDYGPDEKGKLPYFCSYCPYSKGLCWPNATVTFDAKMKPIMYAGAV